ncbi:ParB/RepB/Spo0J family partition protein [Tichowtungia aerotolerans]|uniref:ParB/RepB/Spo0J family partition protein n=1 Tax=Tichowtungia aerotolerans TaxID=2697043 RepID=A0A6P1MA55_9BACT|nr:ParB/RepB/Spo0J family partition protein [Tichowtungia aerotolerans]QHI69963.1 ParB/RepB/Spo0J family partition protein [Tichowtungia aerotolerans]
MAKRQALGRGIGALVKEVPKAAPPPEAPAPDSEGITKLAISKVKANPDQPRRTFDDTALKELTASIQEHGVLQPLLVRPKGKQYQVIAGERRLRAATAAELSDVPVIILDIDDQQALEIALIENLQRDDLNIIETATGYKELADKFDLTQDQIAKRVGKARASVANMLRLLELPSSVKKLLENGQLSAGHGKVLLSVDIDVEKELLATRIVRENLSVRALEKIVEKMKAPPKKPRAQKSDLPIDYIRHLSEKLHQHFGTAVKVNSTKTLANGKKMKGSIEIDYYSNDDLTRFLEIVGITSEDL